MQETRVQFLSQEDPLEKEQAAHSSTLGFPGDSDSKESVHIAEDLGSILGLGRLPGEGNGDPFHYSCQENPHGQRTLVGYSPWGHKVSHMT